MRLLIVIVNYRTPALVIDCLRSLADQIDGESRVVIADSFSADDSIERLRTLMAVPTLADIFSQLAIEQDTAAISRQIADLILA